MANENSVEFLTDVLTPELAAFVLCGTKERLFEYETNPETMPAAVKARLDFLLKIIKHLEGAYNEEGICQWFFRPRTQLGGKKPAEIFQRGRWNPEEELPQKVLRLAESLGDANST